LIARCLQVQGSYVGETMPKQWPLLPALGFVGLIAVSAVGQNPGDPANVANVANMASFTANQKCASCNCPPSCAREPYAVASPEWYDNGQFDPARRTEKLSRQLKLTADQQSQIWTLWSQRSRNSRPCGQTGLYPGRSVTANWHSSARHRTTGSAPFWTSNRMRN
jgi:hypothetical protein